MSTETMVLRLEHSFEPGLRVQLWHGAQRANREGGWGYHLEELEKNTESLQIGALRDTFWLVRRARG